MICGAFIEREGKSPNPLNSRTGLVKFGSTAVFFFGTQLPSLSPEMFPSYFCEIEKVQNNNNATIRVSTILCRTKARSVRFFFFHSLKYDDNSLANMHPHTHPRTPFYRWEGTLKCMQQRLPRGPSLFSLFHIALSNVCALTHMQKRHMGEKTG